MESFCHSSMFREGMGGQTQVIIHPKEQTDYCCQLHIVFQRLLADKILSFVKQPELLYVLNLLFLKKLLYIFVVSFMF